MDRKYMMVDNIPLEINGEKNVLEIIRKAGIDLPTFCYYSDLSIYGACRMCVVEDERGNIDASCSMVPRAGLTVFTNTERLRKYRKNILELLLSNHCRDCTSCDKSGVCRLQKLAARLGIKKIRFDNTAHDVGQDNSSVCITREPGKCILCGDCVRMCNEVQNVGAIDFMQRGSEMFVGTAFDQPISETNCVGCGQCAAICPTGAIIIKQDVSKLWKDLDDKDAKVVVQIAPAVRVGIGAELGMKPGENTMGKIVAVLKKMGFDEVHDTSTSADITVIEESNEFLGRVANGGKLPIITSCCPAWIRHAENKHQDLFENISSCRSPMQMFASVLKEYHKDSPQRLVSVAIMPCTAKKYEAARDEFKVDGVPNVDYVITTSELVRMINESGILFSEVEAEAVDMPFGISSGAGVIFGVTGGVTEAVIRKVADDKSPGALKSIAFTGVRGLEGVKEFTIKHGDLDVKIAVVSGLKNADDLLAKLKAGEVEYHLIEVMACPNGCICGAGQPFNPEVREKRMAGLYEADRLSNIKRSQDNPVVTALYDGLLKGREHELLHVHYNVHK